MTRLVISAATAFFGLLSAPLWSDSASAERRVALVIGNSAYHIAASVPNPIRDARAIAAMFRKAGFDVVSAHYDLGNMEFKRAVRQFEDAATDADTAVVFYAGHGIEIRGVNYMIPVDAKLVSDRDAEDEAITLERLLDSVDAATRLRLVILDACRDNPFLGRMKRQRTAEMRAVAAGLGIIEPPSRNTLIAYAAKAGFAAEDGTREHSPFTAALLNHLFEPGLDIRMAFGRVRDDVLKSTGNRQEPFVSGSLGGGHISLVPASARPTTLAAPDLAAQRSDYALVERINAKGAWEAFLAQYPAGLYAELARHQLAKLIAAEQEAAAGLERLRGERERADRERIEQERATREEAQLAHKARIEAERERQVREQAERERAQRERDERRRLAEEQAERAQRELQAAIQAERERVAREQAERERAQRELARLEAERQAPAQAEHENTSAVATGRTQTALLTPPAQPVDASPAPSLAGGALVREIKRELKRVGCYFGGLDESWPAAEAKAAMQKFARIARVAAETSEPSIVLLAAIRAKSGRVCPLDCGHRQVEKEGRCVAKTCPAGFTLDGDGDCQRKTERSKTAARPAEPRPPEPSRERSASLQGHTKSSEPSGTPRVRCNRFGCQEGVVTRKPTGGDCRPNRRQTRWFCQ